MYLDGIVQQKREDVVRQKKAVPLKDLQGQIEGLPPPLDFGAALKGSGIRLIAEIKRASPSKGALAPDLDPGSLAVTYASNGAAAISVLTETPNFRGSLDHLLAVKKSLDFRPPPVLRKDFIFDPYQVYEARCYRADAILLIAAILSNTQLQELLGLSHQLGMHCLVEVHTLEELNRAVEARARTVGINNRDLNTFKVDLETTERLLQYVPAGHTVVSESGVRSREDVARLEGWGVDAVLIGEALVTVREPGEKIAELLGRPTTKTMNSKHQVQK